MLKAADPGAVAVVAILLVASCCAALNTSSCFVAIWSAFQRQATRDHHAVAAGGSPDSQAPANLAPAPAPAPAPSTVVFDVSGMHADALQQYFDANELPSIDNAAWYFDDCAAGPWSYQYRFTCVPPSDAPATVQPTPTKWYVARRANSQGPTLLLSTDEADANFCAAKGGTIKVERRLGDSGAAVEVSGRLTGGAGRWSRFDGVGSLLRDVADVQCSYVDADKLQAALQSMPNPSVATNDADQPTLCASSAWQPVYRFACADASSGRILGNYTAGYTLTPRGARDPVFDLSYEKETSSNFCSYYGAKLVVERKDNDAAGATFKNVTSQMSEPVSGKPFDGLQSSFRDATCGA